MKDISAALLAVFAGILALAMVSVIISKKSDTQGVIQAAATALSKVIQAAVTPVAASSNSATVSSGIPTQAVGSSFLGGLMSYPLF